MRWLVAGRVLSRTGGPLRSSFERFLGAVAGAAYGLRRICPLAKGLVAGSGSGKPTRLLEAAVERRANHARSAHGPAASAGAKLSRRAPALRLARPTDRCAQGPGAAGRGHLVHGLAGDLPDFAPPLYGPGGYSHRFVHRGTDAR